MSLEKYIVHRYLRTFTPTLYLAGNITTSKYGAYVRKKLTRTDLSDILDTLINGYTHQGEHYPISGLHIAQLDIPLRYMKEFIKSLCQIPTLTHLHFDTQIMHSRVLHEKEMGYLTEFVPSSNIQSLKVKCQDSLSTAVHLATIIRSTPTLTTLRATISDDQYGYHVTSTAITSPKTFTRLELPHTVYPTFGTQIKASVAVNPLLRIAYSDQEVQATKIQAKRLQPITLALQLAATRNALISGADSSDHDNDNEGEEKTTSTSPAKVTQPQPRNSSSSSIGTPQAFFSPTPPTSIPTNSNAQFVLEENSKRRRLDN